MNHQGQTIPTLSYDRLDDITVVKLFIRMQNALIKRYDLIEDQQQWQLSQMEALEAREADLEEGRINEGEYVAESKRLYEEFRKQKRYILRNSEYAEELYTKLDNYHAQLNRVDWSKISERLKHKMSENEDALDDYERCIKANKEKGAS